MSMLALLGAHFGLLGSPDAEMVSAILAADTIRYSLSAATRVMNPARTRQQNVNVASASEKAGRQASFAPAQRVTAPRRTSDAPRPPRQSANSAPVFAMRQEKPTLLTIINASRLHRKTARQGASACAVAVV